MFVRLSSHSDTEWVVLRQGFGMQLQFLDEVGVLAVGLEIVDLAEFDELFTFERVECWRVEEDLGG